MYYRVLIYSRKHIKGFHCIFCQNKFASNWTNIQITYNDAFNIFYLLLSNFQKIHIRRWSRRNMCSERRRNINNKFMLTAESNIINTDVAATSWRRRNQIVTSRYQTRHSDDFTMLLRRHLEDVVETSVNIVIKWSLMKFLLFFSVLQAMTNNGTQKQLSRKSLSKQLLWKFSFTGVFIRTFQTTSVFEFPFSITWKDRPSQFCFS